ncbi:MAG: hypothetical protein HYU88_11855 [Chloroflexi bacterium]|nr:hypothetical protein [Chloroflexota bacterium]
MPGSALLLIRLDVDPAIEDEFNVWYHEEHIPNMLRKVPGFLSGRRYRAVGLTPGSQPNPGQQRYLALYELADAGVVESPTYWATRPSSATASERSKRMYGEFRNFARGVYQRVLSCPDLEPADLSAARYVLQVSVEVDPAVDEEFNDWYNTEHLPLLAAAEGVLRAHRYKVHPAASRLAGDLTTYVALYDMASPEAMISAGWKHGVTTPWTKRIRTFFRRRIFDLYERVYPA